MKNKILLLFLLVVPAAFWVFFEKVKINSKRLNYFGPKRVVDGSDTLFYQITDTLLKFKPRTSFVIIPVNERYASKQYHIQCILEVMRFRPEKLNNIPLIFLCLKSHDYDFMEVLRESKANVQIQLIDSTAFSLLMNALYREKPYYVFDYFGVLVDKDLHIRGYYNFTFADEVRRMTQEYQHLRLKEEGKKLKEEYAIEQK